MFSVKEKQFIAAEVEKLLLGLKHPEMPDQKPKFHLKIQGEKAWSWADIEPNWKFDKDNPPGVNPFNEISRQLHDRPTKTRHPPSNRGQADRG